MIVGVSTRRMVPVSASITATAPPPAPMKTRPFATARFAVGEADRDRRPAVDARGRIDAEEHAVVPDDEQRAAGPGAGIVGGHLAHARSRGPLPDRALRQAPQLVGEEAPVLLVGADEIAALGILEENGRRAEVQVLVEGGDLVARLDREIGRVHGDHRARQRVRRSRRSRCRSPRRRCCRRGSGWGSSRCPPPGAPRARSTAAPDAAVANVERPQLAAHRLVAGGHADVGEAVGDQRRRPGKGLGRLRHVVAPAGSRRSRRRGRSRRGRRRRGRRGRPPPRPSSRCPRCPGTAANGRRSRSRSRAGGGVEAEIVVPGVQAAADVDAAAATTGPLEDGMSPMPTCDAEALREAIHVAD